MSIGSGCHLISEEMVLVISGNFILIFTQDSVRKAGNSCVVLFVNFKT